jgi:hypothetical protein
MSEGSSSSSSLSALLPTERTLLETAASVASFRSTPIHSFRRQLRRCLQDSVISSSSSIVQLTCHDDDATAESRTVTSDSNKLRETLKGLPWKEICQFHDDRHGNNNDDEDHQDDRSTTPLQEVLTQLLDPTVVPHSCVGVVVEALLMEALLEAPRRAATVSANTTAITRWTPSQLIFLQAIKTLWTVCPALNHSFQSSTMSAALIIVKSQQNNTLHCTPHKWNRLLSAASHLAGDCPQAHSTMMAFLLKILGHVDQMEMDLLLQSSKSESGDERTKGRAGISCSRRLPTDNDCPRCHNNNSNSSTQQRSSRKGVRIANYNLEDLHERDNIVTYSSTASYRPQILPPQRVAAISLKKVLSAKRHHTTTTINHTNADCPECHCARTNHLTTSQNKTTDQTIKIPREWAVVRCRGYKKFLGLFQKHPILLGGQRRRDSSSTLLPCNKFDLHLLLQAAHDNYQSPSIRLCLLLTCCRNTNKSSSLALYACRITWARFVGSSTTTTKDPIWLRIYTEIVTEWSCFDNGIDCWNAVRPLVDYAMRTFNMLHENDDGWEQDGRQQPQTQDTDVHRHIFQCLAQILSRRGRLLLLPPSSAYDETKIQENFQSFLTNLAIRFGEKRWWFDANEMDSLDLSNTRFCTLQRLGILGLTSLNVEDDEETETLLVTPNTAAKSDTNSIVTNYQLHSSEEEALQDWPFSEPFDLRSAYDRVGLDGRTKFEDWDSLLSARDFDENLGRLEDQRSGKVGDRNTAGPPLTDYIGNPDLLLHIFQYSGYQEIVKCRQVCNVWKTMIDSSNCLWLDIYRSRFSVHPADPRTGSNESGMSTVQQEEDWNGLFIQKLIVERSLLHRRHQGTGWKHRTCSFIGCYHILKSERLEAMHYIYHQRQSAAKKASRPKRQKKPAKSKKKRAVGKREESSSSVSKKRAKTGFPSR